MNYRYEGVVQRIVKVKDKTWELTEGRKVVGSKWIFTRELDADGNIMSIQSKAIIAQGYSQKFWEDYEQYLIGTSILLLPYTPD